MTLLRAVLVLILALGLQAGLGRLWPAAQGYVDAFYLPVVWYALAGSQRGAMLVGCAAGLLQDAWFQVGVFGLNGFKKTLLGWAMGGLGSRFDLNSQAGRLLGGSLVSIADSILDLALRHLLDQESRLPGALELLGRAVLTGLLVVLSFALVQRVRERRLLSRWF